MVASPNFAPGMEQVSALSPLDMARERLCSMAPASGSQMRSAIQRDSGCAGGAPRCWQIPRSSTFQLVRKSYEAWDLLWKEIGPALTRQVARDNYIRVFNESRRNMRAREKVHPVKVE